MIACVFILCVNLAVIKSLFQWNSSVFVVAAGGSATSNVPVATASLGFGAHSVLWLSAILTFYLMFRIFNLTREQLNSYVGKGMDNLYTQVTGDATKTVKNIKNLGTTLGKAFGWIKKK